MLSLEIQKFTENDRQEWDNFVNSHLEGRYSQLIGYKDVVEKTFGYEASYWLFRRVGEIVAVFPSFVKRSWILGSKLISQPFCEYGGLLAGNLTEEDCVLLRHKLRELLTLHRIPFLEVHGGIGLHRSIGTAIFSEKPLHQYTVLELAPAKEIWERKIDRMARKAIRKAERSGLECYQQTTERSLEDNFYPLYLRSMKDFGSPPYPLSFFLNCLRYLSEYIKLFLVSYQGEVIASLLGFTTGKRVHIVFAPSNERYWDKRPNDLAHWEFIKWAANNHYELFDFGPARYEGQRRYKEKWGVNFFDYSYFFLSQGQGHPNSVMIYSKKAELFASLWKKLVPLSLTKVIGPWFCQQLGD